MLHIVVPVFNRKDFTKVCLLSLKGQSNQQFKIILVDDGSTDGTDIMMQQEFPEVHVIKGNGNLFWTASVNLGIRHALQEGATYILTLNNDVVCEISYINNLLKETENFPDALQGSFAIDSISKKPYYGGAILNWNTDKTTYLLDVLPKNQQHGLHRVTHFPGRGLLIPSQVFNKIGLFDEVNFPHYYADYDFTQRADRAGFAVYCNYNAQLFTYPEESGDRQNRRSKSLKNYYNHLFGIKGGGNLVTFTKYSMRHCPPQLLPKFLARGYAQRILGYFLK